MSLIQKDLFQPYPVCAEKPAVQRIGFRDIDEQAAQLLGHDQYYQQISAGAFRGEFTTAALGPNEFLFIEETNQALIAHGSAPTDQCSFLFLLADDAWCRFQGQDFTSSDLGLLVGGSAYSVRCPPESHFCVITIDRAALRDMLDLDGARFRSTCRLQSPHLPLIVDALRSLVRTTFSILEGSNDAAYQQSTLVNLRQALVSTVGLALSTHDGKRVPPEGRLFQSACEVVNADLREIDVATLCRSLNISRRTLEVVFHDELGIGPARYIKTLRLNQIRREILASGPHQPLADIAANWGMWHPSHFSESYAAMFGELPSHSRRR